MPVPPARPENLAILGTAGQALRESRFRGDFWRFCPTCDMAVPVIPVDLLYDDLPAPSQAPALWEALGSPKPRTQGR